MVVELKLTTEKREAEGREWFRFFGGNPCENIT